MDKEYILLNEIEKNENITQRELSKKTQLSLGSVNILLNKMARNGLIKIKQIPMNRVVYMLTPAGISEKVKKTSSYIKIHYNYINNTVKNLKIVLTNLQEKEENLLILLENDEISELVELAVSELQSKQNIVIINELDKTPQKQIRYSTIIVLSLETYNKLIGNYTKVINLLELI